MNSGGMESKNTFAVLFVMIRGWNGRKCWDVIHTRPVDSRI
jgi:hypothetical protein